MQEEDESPAAADADAPPDSQSGDAEPGAPSAAAPTTLSTRQPAPPPTGAGGHASRARRSRRTTLRVSKAGGYRSEDSDDELAAHSTPPLRKAVSCDRLQNARQTAEDAIRVRMPSDSEIRYFIVFTLIRMSGRDIYQYTIRSQQSISKHL